MQNIRLALNAWSLMSTHAGIASYTRNLALALQGSGAVDLSLFYGLNWASEVREHRGYGRRFAQGLDKTRGPEAVRLDALCAAAAFQRRHPRIGL